MPKLVPKMLEHVAGRQRKDSLSCRSREKAKTFPGVVKREVKKKKAGVRSALALPRPLTHFVKSRRQALVQILDIEKKNIKKKKKRKEKKKKEKQASKADSIFKDLLGDGRSEVGGSSAG